MLAFHCICIQRRAVARHMGDVARGGGNNCAVMLRKSGGTSSTSALARAVSASLTSADPGCVVNGMAKRDGSLNMIMATMGDPMKVVYVIVVPTMVVTVFRVVHVVGTVARKGHGGRRRRGREQSRRLRRVHERLTLLRRRRTRTGTIIPISSPARRAARRDWVYCSVSQGNKWGLGGRMGT